MKDRFLRFGMRHYHLSIILAILFICAIYLLNHWLFNAIFHRSYFSWYVNTGPVFGLVGIVIASAWKNLDEHTGLISKNPYEYLGSYAQVAGLAMGTLAPLVDPKCYSTRPPLLDYVIGLFSVLLLVFTIVAWLIFVVPLQYFVFFVCGALPRVAANSSIRVVAWLQGPTRKQLEFKEQLMDGAIPENGWVATVTDKPFKLTAAFSAAFLFLLGQIINF